MSKSSRPRTAPGPQRRKSRHGPAHGGNGGNIGNKEPQVPQVVLPVQVIVTGEEGDRKEELSNKDYDKLVKTTKFTQFEIVQLYNSFKLEFPTGKINRKQLGELVKRVFPKSNHPVVLDNIFHVFDPGKTGSVQFSELLMAFSMSMRGTVEDKLKWAFKLYDVDGSGEIDEGEMQEIFEKLCQISTDGVSGPSPADIKKKKEQKQKEREMAKLKAEERKRKEEEERKKRNNLLGVNLEEFGLMSDRHKRMIGLPNESKPASIPPPASTTKITVKEADGKDETKEKAPGQQVQHSKMQNEVLKDPERDCTKFDVKQRAKELFEALDEDGSGGITEDEFIDGCMLDDVFVKLLDDFNGDHIFGDQPTPRRKLSHP